MKKSRASSIFCFALAAIVLLTSTSVFADNKDKDADKAKPKSKLSDKENPEMIGKRDINSHQINFYSIQKEIGIGQQLSGDVERQLKFIDDPVITEYVNRVGQNIVLNSDAKVPFTIRVVDSDEINAFALPGGYFYVNKGLILNADNEAEIVGVMAHEIAHVAARHGTEQVSKGRLFQYGSIPLIFLGGPIGIAAQSAANIALPLTFLKFSRNAEAEADMLGAEYAWASGYDPNGMVAMFEKLAAKDKNKPGSVSKLFSDHPATGDRASTVRALITKFPDREEYIVNTSDFNRIKARLQALSGGSGSRLGNGNGNGGDNGRPSLKKRRDNDTQGTDIDTDNGQPPAPKERPTLKRRDSDPDYNNDPQPANDSAPARPTLKRSTPENPNTDNNNNDDQPNDNN